MLSADDVRAILRKEVERAGSQAELAREIGCSFDYLNGVLTRRFTPGKKLLRALGLRRVMLYEVDLPVADLEPRIEPCGANSSLHGL